MKGFRRIKCLRQTGKPTNIYAKDLGERSYRGRRVYTSVFCFRNGRRRYSRVEVELAQASGNAMNFRYVEDEAVMISMGTMGPYEMVFK